jgi:hypothetical protein
MRFIITAYINLDIKVFTLFLLTTKICIYYIHVVWNMHTLWEMAIKLINICITSHTSFLSVRTFKVYTLSNFSKISCTVIYHSHHFSQQSPRIFFCQTFCILSKHPPNSSSTPTQILGNHLTKFYLMGATFLDFK